MSGLPLKLLVALGGGIWALALSGNGWVIPVSFFAPMSKVAMALSLVLVAFDKWLWHLPVVRSLVGRPYLAGTWSGTLDSDWEDPASGSKAGPIPVFAVVRQSFTSLHVRVLTRESQSQTLAVTLLQDPDGQRSVAGVYRNVPRKSVRQRSEIHSGGFMLDIQGSPAARMFGHYWTDRATAGEFSLALVGRRTADDFASAEGLAGKAPEASRD